MLECQDPCVSAPFSGHCYVPLPSAHKHSESIMDEAFPALSSPRWQRAVSLWGGPEASALTSNRCFIIHTGVLTKRWMSLGLLTALVNNRDHCEITLTSTSFSLSQCSVFPPLAAHHMGLIAYPSLTLPHLPFLDFIRGLWGNPRSQSYDLQAVQHWRMAEFYWAGAGLDWETWLMPVAETGAWIHGWEVCRHDRRMMVTREWASTVCWESLLFESHQSRTRLSVGIPTSGMLHLFMWSCCWSCHFGTLGTVCQSFGGAACTVGGMCVCIHGLYVCMCVCLPCFCVYAGASHSSGCVSWRRRRASSEAGPVTWGPGSCAWSWSVGMKQRRTWRRHPVCIASSPLIFNWFTRLTVIIYDFLQQSVTKSFTVTLQITHITKRLLSSTSTKVPNDKMKIGSNDASINGWFPTFLCWIESVWCEKEEGNDWTKA